MLVDIKDNWSLEYPRPQLKRDSFYSLNGEWLLNNHSIIIPFCPESKLSNYKGELSDHLRYSKSFVLPNDFINERVILHFGAVDQICDVYLNKHHIGHNEGGYIPFSFDITDYLEDENELVVEAIDTLSHDYPYGKQKKDHKGMWYTPVSGIWQSVWLESVSKDYIKNIRITPTLHSIHIDIESDASEFVITIPLKTKVFKETYYSKSIDIFFDEEDIELWDENNPYLYQLLIDTNNDHIESYFALREIKIVDKDLLLNNKKIFLHGVLDQGYYLDGIFLSESPKEVENDVKRMKELGFNLLRKHIKIEPEVFYYACDKLGVLVMQDMVNNGGYSYIFDTVLPTIGFVRRNDQNRSSQREMEIFEKEMVKTLNHLYNHPCIISYTIFNEGWGQFKADHMYDLCKELDPSRFYDATSGWFPQNNNDVDSYHVYFRNKVLKTRLNKPIFLSECGGFSREVEGHMYLSTSNYGYGATHSEEELTNKIVELYEKMVYPSIKNGLCGCIYTQVSDIEDEINGLYTYDREYVK